MSIALHRLLSTVVASLIVLASASSVAVAQIPGSVVVRGGATFSPEVSGEGEIRIWRAMSLVASVRGVRTGFGCTGVVTVSPCIPDGVSLGMASRVTVPAPWSSSFYAEAGGGLHAYEHDSWYPFVEGGAGFAWRIRCDGVFELGTTVKRIGASRFSTIQPNYGIIPGSAHQVAASIVAELGIVVW